MKVRVAGLRQLGGSIAEGVKAFFTVPECQVCKIRENNFHLFRCDFQARVKHLEEQIAAEKDEKAELQQALFRALRVGGEVKVGAQTNPIALRGIVNPRKQRMSAEVESRKKYWENKANEKGPLPEGVVSRTEG